MSEEAKKIVPVHTKKTYTKLFKIALYEKDELELKRYIEKKKAIFLSTPQEKQLID